MRMAYSDSHASEAARALAARRWSPETRLRAALATLAEHTATLTDAQRDAIRHALDEDGDDGE